MTSECDRLRTEVDRYGAELAAERDSRLAEVDERRRGETRLQAIEELLAQFRPKNPPVAAP